MSAPRPTLQSSAESSGERAGRPAHHDRRESLRRRAAAVVVAAGLIAALAACGATAATPQSNGAARSSTPTPAVTPEPDAPDLVSAPVDAASVVASATQTTATALLETLPVKGRAPKTGYDRTGEFGAAWLDVDRNGCDTRNDILGRDLHPATVSGGCRVVSGTLLDAYTGKTIPFTRGNTTSLAVQIDHVVPLLNAWETGAQNLTRAQRISLANDPLNLIAVGAAVNAQKSAGDAATWLPPKKDFRCAYVARQVSVKATYGLWVTKAEHDAIARVLSGCADQQAPVSPFAPLPVPQPESTAESVNADPAPPAPAAPAPAPPAPAPPAPAPPAPAPPAPAPPAPPAPAPPAPADAFYPNCAAARAAGVAPIHVGEPGYSRKLDRDGDGVACE
ncbi:DUF1524 domain-containing protein [Leifsonia sp. NPDC102414]|uniref:GmrSD restriction endonuclease domain-containing protein n=1 Tax=Leifsonia sp. NPDC102414 TaxID=3364124 RepID=UPI00381331C1